MARYQRPSRLQGGDPALSSLERQVRFRRKTGGRDRGWIICYPDCSPADSKYVIFLSVSSCRALTSTTVVCKMINFIRSPMWITAEFHAELAPQGRETRFSPEEIEKFKADPQYFLQYRKRLYNLSGANFPVYFKTSDKQKSARERFTAMMRERLNFDEGLCEKIIPDFAVGCRR